MKPLAWGVVTLTIAGIGLAQTSRTVQPRYCWKERLDVGNQLSIRIPPPPGFERLRAEPGSFGEWLRGLPLRDAGAPVLLFDRRPKARQDVHAAVVDIDVGNRDLQQCADAVIRLRGEYLFSRGKADDIHFLLTNGQTAHYRDWAAGRRPVLRQGRIAWKQTKSPDRSHQSFRQYLDFIFAYAGTLSLSRELRRPEPGAAILPGDVFILGGSPGHAVIVLDVAVRPGSNRRVFLLAQSYMPAQDIHILKNPTDSALSPWYDADFGEKLVTPEWNFEAGDRRRF